MKMTPIAYILSVAVFALILMTLFVCVLYLFTLDLVAAFISGVSAAAVVVVMLLLIGLFRKMFRKEDANDD